MSDFFVRLIESARGAPPPVRAVMPIEVDEEVVAPARAAATPASGQPRQVVPSPAPPSVRERAESLRATGGRRDPALSVAPIPFSPAAVAPVPAARDAAPAWVTGPAPASPRERVDAPAPPPPALVAAGRRRRPTPPTVIVGEHPAQVAPEATGGEEAPASRHALAASPVPGPPPLAQAQPPSVVTEEVVHVSIGRIEVRVAQPAPVLAAAAASPARPRQSLDDYLAARDRGRR